MNAEPTADVTVQVVSGNTSAVTVHPVTLTFTPDNYGTRQEVTYTGVDDNIPNHPTHRRTTVTYTASGGNYAGISTQSSVLAYDDEPIPFTVVEGRSYTLRIGISVTQGCAPETIRPTSSDPGVLTVDPPTLTWTEQNTGTQQPLTVTFHDNNYLGDGRVTLHLPITRTDSGLSHRPCDEVPVLQDIIFTVTDNDTGILSVDAIPACGTTVTDSSVEPVSVLKLTPAPATEVETEYRPITEDNPADDWLGSRSIGTSGRSIPAYHSPLSALRRAYPGFAGFEWRLKDDPDVTAQCTWQFDDDDGGTTPRPPATPSVRLSASPNPVDEGSLVTVTARLSEALSSDVTIPLTLSAGTAEAGDFGSLSSITISAGSATGTGTISTSEDADTDDETFTVALGNLPSSVTAGSPSSVRVTIRDEDGGGGNVGGGGGGGGVGQEHEPPVAVADTARTAEDTEVLIDVLANDTDAEDDALTIESVTDPTNGTMWIAADDQVAYAPEPDWHGTDRFTYTVADGNGGTALAEVVVVVVPVNDAPIAVADTARTAEDTEVLIDVLANDTDVDGDTLTIGSVTDATNGMARIASDGRLAYAPEPDWHGTDRFAYTVADGNGGTAEAEVVVVVETVNDAPVALADTVRTEEDTEVLVDVLANDTDVDGDALTIESVTNPPNGTTWMAADGQVAYAPEPDWHGTDRFTYAVADGKGGTALAEVVVVVVPVNDAPIAVADTARTAEDTEVLIDVLANDSDVDGDALTIESVTNPPNGTTWMAADGQVAYAPEPDWHGTDRFTYAVADGKGGTADAEVEVVIAPVNDAPVVVGAVPEQTLEEGGAAAVLDLISYFEDPDGDPLTYYAVSSDQDVATVVVAGSMLTLTPVEYGEASIEVTARDPGGLAARQAFRVGATDQTVRMVLDETLAAMARAHLASARMTLGRRAGPSGVMSGSMLKVMGRQVPLNRAAALEAAGRMLESWVVSQRLRDGGLRNLVIPGGKTEWVYAFGDQEESTRPGGAWQFWGQGDIQTFAGEPSPESGYDGDLRTGWAGIDRAFGARWLVGVSVARSTGWGDWRAGTAEGRLETSLTALHPYLHWSDGASSMWLMAGGGRGSAENTRATGRVGESDLELSLGAFEVRHRLVNWFGFRADAAWARLETGEGTETVDSRSATVDQQRLGIELSPSSRSGSLALEPFVQTNARRDGGAGQSGQGIELSGGFRVVGGFLRIDAQGRILLLHSAEGYEERGLGATVSLGRQAAAEGLSLSVSPRWGGPAAATDVLWREQLIPRPLHGSGPREAWSLDATARYGQRLPGGRLIKWFGSFNRSRKDWGLAVGVGFGLPGGVKHAGRRFGHVDDLQRGNRPTATIPNRPFGPFLVKSNGGTIAP